MTTFDPKRMTEAFAVAPASSRRRLLAAAGIVAATGFMGLMPSFARAAVGGLVSHKVLIVGAGVGGATAAKYLKLWAPEIDVTVIDRNPTFIRHYGSSEHLTGAVSMADLTVSYDGLRARGVKVVQAAAVGLDPDRKVVHAESNGLRQSYPYDTLIVSPGVELLYDAVPGYSAELAETKIPSGWIAGAQTELLRRQLLAMPEDGTFVLVAPPNPYRCPPGPYERSALVTEWMQHHKPKGRVVILDPKNDFVTDETMILGWNHLYGFAPPSPYREKLDKFMVEPKADCRIEWRREKDGGKPLSIDPNTLTVQTPSGSIKADVLNIVPPMRAAAVAQMFGLTDKTGFCPIDRRTFASTLIEDVYVIGDASIADAMPKSGFSANTQAKVCVRAILSKLAGQSEPEPAWSNTCYALAGDDWGLFVADTFRIVNGKIARTNTRARYQDLSASRVERQVAARYLRAWMRSITADSFG